MVEYAKVWIRPYDIYISQTKCHVSSDYKFQMILVESTIICEYKERILE